MNLVNIIKDLNANKNFVLEFSKNDFWNKYTGSYLGVFWAFVQPILTIMVFWFVFQIGFKVMPLGDTPFLLWLMCGLVSWFFFSEGTLNAANCFIDYSYLVKKVVFKVSILPIIKVISALYVHIFFLVFLIFVFYFYGYEPNIYYLQIIYYLLAVICLMLGISYITSTVIVFFRDLYQILSLIFQFSIWLTPIMWNENMIPEKFIFLFKLNPIYYIVEGYRDTFIDNLWFWHRPFETIYFWTITFILMLIGSFIYKKMKPHFSDVL